MAETAAAFLFDQPFQEAVDSFLEKQVMTRAEFDLLAAGEKARSFTVARIFAADQLQRVYDTLGQTLEKGLTYRDFVKATENIIMQPWHRETVFRTNILSADGAGHWRQAQLTKESRPYVIYRDMGDGRVRVDHRLGGLVLAIDDPFVRSHWGPWAHN